MLLPPQINKCIEGRRVIIRPITLTDITDRYIAWLNDARVTRFLEVRWKKQSFEDVVSYINNVRRSPGCEAFGIFEKKSNKHVGNVFITDYSPNTNGIAIYGIMIGDTKAKKIGLGGDVTLLIIDFLFSQPGIRRIQEKCISSNIEASSVLERVGFTKEGILRQAAVLSDGKIDDVSYYGLLRKEWNQSRNEFQWLLKDIEIHSFIL